MRVGMEVLVLCCDRCRCRCVHVVGVGVGVCVKYYVLVKVYAGVHGSTCAVMR